MSSSPQTLADAQRALLDTTMKLGSTAMDGLMQLSELNMQAGREAWSETSEISRSTPRPGSMGPAAALMGPWRPDALPALMSHFQRVMQVLLNMQAEMLRLTQQQASCWERVMEETVSASSSLAMNGHAAEHEAAQPRGRRTTAASATAGH